MIKSTCRKGKNCLTKIFMVLPIIWICSIAALSFFTYNTLSNGIRNELGNKAMLLALDISQKLIIEENEVKRLLELDFNQLLKDPLNIKFEDAVRFVIKGSDIKYVYIEAPLSKSKYIVERGEEEIYNAKAGTELSVVYLLDAAVSDAVRLEDTSGKGYEDKDRYTVMDKSFLAAYKSKTPSFHISQNRWGNYITGYAPFYDSGGNYIGLLGVDIFIEKYNESLKNYLLVIAGFIFINLIVGILAIYLGIKAKYEKMQAHEKYLLSSIDDLTSIFNRRKFREIVEGSWENAIENNQELSMVFIDIDYFKEFNDNYGHLKGDELLKKLARLFKTKAEQYKGFAGRFGGDEFVILLPDANIIKAKKAGEDILKTVEELRIPHDYSAVSKYQTVSIGVTSTIPTKDAMPEILFSHADIALYQAKRYGRNRVCLW
ncbi:GGDEF domain-containing protein [Lutispora saccharofermentans]|uniref:Diguanylate cyclase n=1 Tax=Lutispora saccharofermentans TaxID=3024236 RepID=A0ABT1NCV9_9FIRM|nr:GGDEF domain-containing protein [Lutispora saccharofermentans]MCQ1528971.1 diguanylate cyclase [Lutispora saccharofermentans]